jgi:hypothetical protein
MDLPQVEYTPIPLEIGGSQLLARSKKWGVKVEYEDKPFDWIIEQEFTNERIFKAGPVTRTYGKMTLEQKEEGTLLEYHIEVTPANVLGAILFFLPVMQQGQQRVGRLVQQVDEAIQAKVKQPLPLPVTGLTETAANRLRQLSQELVNQGCEQRWADKLADFLTNEADINLARIRPYQLADEWQAPRQAILEMFLSATKIGLLNMRWDVMCPLCRGSNESHNSLDQLQKGVHCPACNVNFEADFAQHVELIFVPHSQIRISQGGQYCIGGPMSTPHIIIHQLIKPGETRTIQARLQPAKYHLRTQRPGVEYWLESNGAKNISIQIDEQAIQVTALPADKSTESGNDMTLTITNSASYEQRFYVEQAKWYTDAVTAAEVTAMQHFRDLFSDEVLRPGEEIGIQGMTILFTDLVGSTAMYNKLGDAPSYALVRRQFDFTTHRPGQWWGDC